MDCELLLYIYIMQYCFDIILAVAVSFEQPVYFAEEEQNTTGIRLKATHFEIPFRVRIFAIALDSSRREKTFEANSSELLELFTPLQLYFKIFEMFIGIQIPFCFIIALYKINSHYKGSTLDH